MILRTLSHQHQLNPDRPSLSTSSCRMPTPSRCVACQAFVLADSTVVSAISIPDHAIKKEKSSPHKEQDEKAPWPAFRSRFRGIAARSEVIG